MSQEINEIIESAIQARREKNLPEAKRRWTAAIALSREAKRRSALIQSLKGLGQIESDLGREADAVPLYEEAVALCREEGDPLLLAHTVRHLGDLHRRAGRWQIAEPCYVEALSLYRSNHATAPLDLANAIRPLAMLKERTGELAEAKSLWEEARGLYESVNVAEGVMESSRRLEVRAKQP